MGKLNQRLRLAIEHADLTHKAFAEAMSRRVGKTISRSTVSGWCSDVSSNELRKEWVGPAAEITGVDGWWLLTGNGDMMPGLLSKDELLSQFAKSFGVPVQPRPFYDWQDRFKLVNPEALAAKNFPVPMDCSERAFVITLGSDTVKTFAGKGSVVGFDPDLPPEQISAGDPAIVAFFNQDGALESVDVWYVHQTPAMVIFSNDSEIVDPVSLPRNSPLYQILGWSLFQFSAP